MTNIRSRSRFPFGRVIRCRLRNDGDNSRKNSWFPLCLFNLCVGHIRSARPALRCMSARVSEVKPQGKRQEKQDTPCKNTRNTAGKESKKVTEEKKKRRKKEGKKELAEPNLKKIKCRFYDTDFNTGDSGYSICTFTGRCPPKPTLQPTSNKCQIKAN